ncbi:MFS transporter [Alicyclobacillus dauci]|uniref:MFS transporter n=1 Tax=Alicyclobacillus dauci TaxID=1475485 RepID=A0ABY6Z3N6_9BACL|nr:MFS transporter [Alicyclobacillus dauci]WAH37243.1 MFS transporter [Alicyclobacillus dauci]
MNYARFSAYYFLFFFTVAVFAPYFSLFLSSRGLSSSQVGLVMAVMPFVGILLQPVWGMMNDRYRAHKGTIIVGLAVISATMFSIGTAHQLVWCLLAAIVIAFFQPVLIPLNDSITVQAAGIEGYGKVRLFGSLGYAVFIVIDSYIIHKYGISRFPLLYLLTSFVAVVPGLMLLPRQQRLIDGNGPVGNRYAGLDKLFRNRSFVLILLFTLFVMISQWINNNFFTLYYVNLHRPLTLLGTVYAISALSELPFFFISGRLITRFGPEKVFLFAAGVYTIRWCVLGFGPATWVIVIVQLFNGMSFGLAFAAGIAIARRVSDHTNHVTAQTVYSAVTTGIASIVGSLLAGDALQHFGPEAIYVTAAITSAIGFCCMIWYVMQSKVHGKDGQTAAVRES